MELLPPIKKLLPTGRPALALAVGCTGRPASALAVGYTEKARFGVSSRFHWAKGLGSD